MVMFEQAGQGAVTRDKDHDLIWFVEQCLSNVDRLEAYAAEAERTGDAELADLFRRAQRESRKGAQLGKDLLRRRLALG